MTRGILAGAMFCSGALAAAEPPNMSTFRYDEDYSYLSDPAARTGAWWEPLKYIPLTDSGEVYLTLGIETRLRYEVLRNDNFGDGPQDEDGYLWLRTLPLADLHAGEHLRVFSQFVSAFAVDREPFLRRVDEDRLDVLQAFVDLRLPLSQHDGQITLRPGRQMLGYGSERLISNRYGPNVPETFDGLKAIGELGSWRADAFWVRPVESDFKVLDDQTDEDRALWSLYLTRQFNSREDGFDVYYIGYSEDSATFNQGSADERRHTVGTRLFGNASGWDWNAEVLYQFGTFGRGDIQAWSFGSDTGYTFAKLPWTPRLSLKANIVSGDNDPADADLQTFNALFPKGKYFGEIGLLGPYNLINLHPTVEIEMNKHWSASVAAVFYWRESARDGIYDNAGNLVRSDGSSSARYIGTQAELVLNYHPARNWEFECALSRFVSGRFIEETGRSKDAYFASAEIRFTF
ncbi:MAG TPA: alginate export family protein [Clostridia bacterium]|nr:alginate export family protein [Clostridia bacterium]